jgi:thiamine pyrophosphate-dependent acetolactate synthase large subunit-like protein
MAIKGYQLLVQSLLKQNVQDLFFLMGGPMLDTASDCQQNGIRMIDVRHEQSAAMMAHAYARLRGVPGVCMACSGPGSINLTTGLANALIDCAPVVALGGSSPVGQYGLGAFQEIDQLAIMRPVTKWAERVYEARRIPEYVYRAFAEARSGKPGPVYLDLPGDVLHHEVDEADVKWPKQSDENVYAKPAAPPQALDRALEMLQAARKPVLLTGSGVLWSGASADVQHFVEATGIPFYTTPQGRGVIPEDHEFFYASARSTAFKDADLFIVVGTRLNYVFGFGRPPRLSGSARQIRIDIDPAEIANGTADLGIVADAATVLRQLNAAIGPDLKASYAQWRATLAAIELERQPKQEAKLATIRCRFIPCACARKSATSWIVMRSSWSTVRRSSTTAGKVSRVLCRATG